MPGTLSASSPLTFPRGGAYITWEASGRARANPSVLIAGEKDLEGRVASINRLFDLNRPYGALWSLEVEEGLGHDFGRSLPLIFLHFQHALDQRLPKSELPSISTRKQL
jgi:hypothetical protein